MGDSTRLLHRRSEHGYTDHPGRALPQEPEAVSREVQRSITAQAQDQAHQLRVAQWVEHRMEIQRRIDWVYSQRLRRDVRSQLRALERQLDRLDKRIAQ